MMTNTQISSISVNPFCGRGLFRSVRNRSEKCLDERCRAWGDTALVACGCCGVCRKGWEPIGLIRVGRLCCGGRVPIER